MTQPINHPDAAYEQTHLTQTIGIIADELEKLEIEMGIRADEDRVVAVRFDNDQAQVMMNTMRMKLQTLHQLALSKKQPYFSRLDFIPTGEVKRTYYIGRWGVTKTPEYEVTVVDWRSPVANLYYSGQVGEMNYTAPDGNVNGELTLKRMFTIHEGKLEAIFDTGVVSQDAYLQAVLGAVSSDKLKEIVTTIQAEQNFVIRHPLEKPLIVQGVAGSGKTTIALHRIAWLLYAYRQTLSPSQMMILAPNPLFLNYISQVLPDLGVDNVIQTTFKELCAKWLKKQMPRVMTLNRLEDRLCMTAQQREQMAKVLRRKGSLAFKAELETALTVFEQHILPDTDTCFGQKVLFTKEALHHIFFEQLRHFPLEARIMEIQKHMKTRLKSCVREMYGTLEKMTEERLTMLLNGLPEGEERQERVAKLLASRDRRKQEIATKEKEYPNQFRQMFPTMKVVDIYRTLLQSIDEALFADTIAMLGKGRVYPEDLAALVVIMKKVYGIGYEPIRTIVIDEAQDFSPFQMKLLHDMQSKPSFTLVGDLMQGIHSDEGITSWEEVKEGVFKGDVVRHDLVQSYRNTEQIMSFANRIAAHFPVAGQRLAKPVLRKGEAVEVVAQSTEAQWLAYVIDKVQAWKQEGFNTIALVARTFKEAKTNYDKLKKHLDISLITQEHTSYHGGVMLIPASLVKGLEFDCVMVLNVEDVYYPYDAFMARLLYVICTRPLHRLALLHMGTCSKLIDA